jgi:hypothetical protein
MAEPWGEEAYRLAEEWGWRVIAAGNGPAKGVWMYAFTLNGTQWVIRCTDEHHFWIVGAHHNWGKDPALQNEIGPFGSFTEAATTYQLMQHAS